MRSTLAAILSILVMTIANGVCAEERAAAHSAISLNAPAYSESEGAHLDAVVSLGEASTARTLERRDHLSDARETYVADRAPFRVMAHLVRSSDDAETSAFGALVQDGAVYLFHGSSSAQLALQLSTSQNALHAVAVLADECRVHETLAALAMGGVLAREDIPNVIVSCRKSRVFTLSARTTDPLLAAKIETATWLIEAPLRKLRRSHRPAARSSGPGPGEYGTHRAVKIASRAGELSEQSATMGGTTEAAPETSESTAALAGLLPSSLPSGASVSFIVRYPDGSARALSGTRLALVREMNGAKVVAQYRDSSGALRFESAGVPIEVTGLTPLTIAQQPVNATARVGDSATFSVKVAGDASGLTYRWYKNGAAIEGANGPTLTISSVSAADAGAGIYVVASLGSMEVQSATVKLLVPASKATLVGDVRINRLPVKGVKITIDGLRVTAKSNASGAFQLSNLLQGSLTVHGSKKGMTFQPRRVVLTEKSGKVRVKLAAKCAAGLKLSTSSRSAGPICKASVKDRARR